jgi:hypothetical protein
MPDHSPFPSAHAGQGPDGLVPDPTRLLLGFALEASDDGPPRRAADRAAIEAALEKLDLAFEDDPWSPDPSPGSLRLNHTQWALWVRDRQGGAIDDKRLQRIRKALVNLCVWIGAVWARPTPGGRVERSCPLPHVLLIGLREDLSDQDVDEAIRDLRQLGLTEHEGRSRYLASRYFVVDQPMKRSAQQLGPHVTQALGERLRHLRFEWMPFASPMAYEPDDEHYGLQWNMPLIEAPRAWDLTRGDPGVVIAVIDSGCDLAHDDLSFSGPGMNLRDPTRNGAPVLDSAGQLDPHGTNVAGIAAAIIDNAPTPIGVAGVAGRCLVLPLATDGFTDVQIAAGIRAAADARVRVVNISGHTTWTSELTDAIDYAHAMGPSAPLLCAAAGNGDARGLLAPARHPFVMACGGSDRRDERWSVVLPGGGVRGSNYGHERVDGVWKGVSVVAPAWDEFPDIGMPTTDITGNEGAVRLPSPDGDYWRIGGFSMTSCATPHVSGVAALLFSLYPGLDAEEVRRIIERTADKVGSVPYDVYDGFPNGTRNEEMGYGRLNAFHAVDLADVMIRDWSGDDGVEPSETPGGYFWVAPDIVVRPDDDGLFVPADIDLSSVLVTGQANYIYVRVVNRGPAEARGVRVDVRAAKPALAFRYPRDWTAEDADHVRPAAVRADLGTMASGAEDRAVFTLSPDQADHLAGWSADGWHPCLLARVTAGNDHAFGGGTDTADRLVARRNNLAQRNLKVAGMASAALTYEYAFEAAHEEEEDAEIRIRVDAGALPRDGGVELCFGEPAGSGGGSPADDHGGHTRCGCGRVRVLDPVRIETSLCGCRAVVSLEPGSEVALGSPTRPAVLKLSGAEALTSGCLRLTSATAEVVLSRPPFSSLPMKLACTYPSRGRNRYAVHVSRLDAVRRAGGGVTMILGPA